MIKIRLLGLLAIWCCFLSFGQVTIYSEDFSGQNNKGAIGPIPTIDTSGVTWTIDVASSSLIASTDWFQVVSEVFEARDVDGPSYWFSPIIDISGYTGVSFSLDALEVGTLEAGDVFETHYRINGGAWGEATTNGLLNDDFGSVIVSESGLSGNSLEIRVTLNCNAADEYLRFDNILVQGVPSCTPTHSITSFSPISGPNNTEVTISGTGFTGSTTVAFNGAFATILSQTSTQLIVQVPAGASTGKVTITESGCDVISNADFTIIDTLNTGCEGSVNGTDLFISQVTDATSGSLSYIELYNGTGGAVNLSNYTLEIRFNASGTTSNHTLNGTLVNQGSYVISTNVDTPCGSVTGSDGTLADEASSMAGVNTPKNGSDCISLYNNTVSTINAIDVWGDCNDKNWRENLGVAIGDEGFDFRRLAASNPPSASFSISDWNIIDWEDNTCADDEYSDIGSYTPGLPPNISLHPLAPTACNTSVELTIAASEGLAGNKSLVFQWYALASGDTAWSLLSDDTTFSGSNSSMLTISNPLLVLDYQFYCSVMEDGLTCYKASNATKVSFPKTEWDGSSWSNGTPDINTIAIIDGNYNTASGSFSACQLLVKSGSILTVSNSKYVEVENNVLVNGQLIVNTKGAFVQNNDSCSFSLGATGSSQVNKFTANLTNWYDYTYWSSPVVDATVGVALSSSDRRFYYDAFSYLDADVNGIDDNADDWKVPASGSIMTPGVGYIGSHTPIGFEFGPSFQYNFIGAFNNGLVSPALAYNAINTKHWNLIGNPYPSALNVNDFFTENVGSGLIEEIVYLWSHHSPPSADNIGNDNLNFSISDYAIINGTGPIAGASGETPGDYIPSGQSFFVNSLKSGNIVFNNSMRVASDFSNEIFFKSSSKGKVSTRPERLWLNLNTSHGVFNQILIGYLERATDGYDGLSFDAQPVYTGYGNLYSSVEGYDYQLGIQGKSIESLNTEEIIPIGFNSWINQETLYTISVPQIEGEFLETNSIYLKDNDLNITHNLSESNYEFTSELGMFPNRFEIVFKESKLSVKENVIKNSLKIIDMNDGSVMFKLEGSAEFKQIKVYDLLGRELYDFEAKGKSKLLNISKISSGAYIAKVKLNNGVLMTKKAVKS